MAFCCCFTNKDETRCIDGQIGLKGAGCSATRMLKVAYIAPIVARFDCFFNSRRLRAFIMSVVGLRCANPTYIRQVGLRLFASQHNYIFGRNAEPQLGESPMVSAKLGLGAHIDEALPSVA